ncbi:MAG: permease-like cell division protein FtsX [Lachnospiraceae bacterium]
MRFNTIVYTIKQGFTNIFKNKMFSLASMTTMAACIFMFGIFYSIVTNFSAMVDNAEQNVSITVFFDEGIGQEQIDVIGFAIGGRSEVASYRFISAEEAWSSFKEDYFGDSEGLADGFAEDNPLANSASYEIYLNDVSKQAELVTYLEGLEGVREVRKSEIAANTLSDFNRLLGYISIGIIAILLFVAVFLISNTITTGITVRKEEIAIMKLIGATDFFVRAPFMVEGVIIGLVGSSLPLVILYLMYNRMIIYVAEKFSFLNNLIQFKPAGEVFEVLVPVALALGFGIGFIGSRLTLHRHLKV